MNNESTRDQPVLVLPSPRFPLPSFLFFSRLSRNKIAGSLLRNIRVQKMAREKVEKVGEELKLKPAATGAWLFRDVENRVVGNVNRWNGGGLIKFVTVFFLNA